MFNFSILELTVSPSRKNLRSTSLNVRSKLLNVRSKLLNGGSTSLNEDFI